VFRVNKPYLENDPTVFLGRLDFSAILSRKYFKLKDVFTLQKDLKN